MAEKEEKPGRTRRLDAHLEERYLKDPRAFRRRTVANLAVALFVLVVAAILGYFAVEVVHLSLGGDALVLMTIMFVLVAVAILDDVRWRMALAGRAPAAAAH